MNRTEQLARLFDGREDFDLLIVGGGATGLGAAVDAAARGWKVALIERADFAKGTSSRSTKLVHGGVRYLKQGNVSLVLEALRERGHLARNAPHLVRDQAFVIPCYGPWDKAFYRIGLKLYDALAGKLGLEPSRGLSRQQALQLVPTVEPAGLRGGVVYHDGQFDDARLAVNLAETAVARGAAVVNYCACTGLVKHEGRVVGAKVRDEETGAESVVRAKVVVNATGVFVDQLRRWDEPGGKDVVAVSQGIHLVLPGRFLRGSAAIMIPKTADGRVLFAIPWHGAVVVGTTDTAGVGAAAEPRALEEERGFVLEHARKYLAEDPQESDVLSVYAGLRPLVKAGEGKSTAALSRDHTILVSASGLVTVTGGKWTTYRRMADDVVTRAEQVAGLVHRACATETLAVHGATKSPVGTEHLRGYGSDAARVEKVLGSAPGLDARIHPELPYQLGEVIWHARHEMARTVEDVLARRTRALLLNARAAAEAAPGVARLLAQELGWNEGWAAAQVAAFRELARGYTFSDPASVGRKTG